MNAKKKTKAQTHVLPTPTVITGSELKEQKQMLYLTRRYFGLPSL